MSVLLGYGVRQKVDICRWVTPYIIIFEGLLPKPCRANNRVLVASLELLEVDMCNSTRGFRFHALKPFKYSGSSLPLRRR